MLREIVQKAREGMPVVGWTQGNLLSLPAVREACEE
ncbi:hypothetical protein Pisl_0974 [Pyrobaculum islandicum DSM 4184]|uniref:Uncharacterized protein n=1 Tax=Pyrobaculum islandicum (strain DSM 4184 / JCM 9189 / GEO3) TaxID=384616 RepID=A1RT68_PYRIL|nr:hypothetical protein Pisl_0974 [Pyrobaculum islandicum DSM 4184]